MFSDSHVHLDGSEPEQLRQGIEGARRGGVEIFIAVGMSLESSVRTVDIGDSYECVFPAVGIHPWNAVHVGEDLYNRLRDVASRKGVVAISEVGLDFARNPETKEIQKQAFEQHVRLAKELGLPLNVHCREAHEEMMEILKKERTAELRGNVHGFSGDEAMLGDWLALGFYISVGRLITRPEGAALEGTVKRIPSDKLLLETDSSPRGLVNAGQEPDLVWVKSVAEKVAEWRGMAAEEIGNTTTANLKRLYGIGV